MQCVDQAFITDTDERLFDAQKEGKSLFTSSPGDGLNKSDGLKSDLLKVELFWNQHV